MPTEAVQHAGLMVQQAPIWLVLISLVIGIILAGIKIYEFVRERTKKPFLKVKLTKEVIYRLLRDGEAIFANAVLLARNGPIEIVEVSFSLTKTDEAKKEYKLEVAKFGSKIPTGEPIAGHIFYSESPIDYIPENQPKRILYLSFIDDYSDKIEQTFQTIDQDSWKLQQELLQIMASGQATQEQGAEFIKKVTEATNLATSELNKFTQIESGKYKLTLKVFYKGAESLNYNTLEKEESSITFSVDSNFDEIFSYKLKKMLSTYTENIVTQANNQFEYPEYKFSDISEIDA